MAARLGREASERTSLKELGSPGEWGEASDRTSLKALGPPGEWGEASDRTSIKGLKLLGEWRGREAIAGVSILRSVLSTIMKCCPLKTENPAIY